MRLNNKIVKYYIAFDKKHIYKFLKKDNKQKKLLESTTKKEKCGIIY